jgi:hypothetical protein
MENEDSLPLAGPRGSGRGASPPGQQRISCCVILSLGRRVNRSLPTVAVRIESRSQKRRAGEADSRAAAHVKRLSVFSIRWPVVGTHRATYTTSGGVIGRLRRVRPCVGCVIFTQSRIGHSGKHTIRSQAPGKGWSGPRLGARPHLRGAALRRSASGMGNLLRGQFALAAEFHAPPSRGVHSGAGPFAYQAAL